MGKDNRLDRFKFWGLVFLLMVITISVFSPIINYEFVFMDDPEYIYQNPHVTSGLKWSNIRWAFTSFHSANWHPLTWLSHMTDASLFGLSPGWHHLFNLIFHTLNGALLFLFFSILTNRLYRSFFLAALFAIHPLHVESVAWVSERKDVLSTFFWILTMILYFWYLKKPKIGRYFAMITAFALGLMAKPMLLTLPFVLLLLDFWPLRRWGITNDEHDIPLPSFPKKTMKFLIFEKLPLMVLTALSGIITFLAQSASGAVVTLEYHPLPIRVGNALVSYVMYLWKMIAPLKLALLYPHPGSTLPFWKPAAAGFLLVVISAIAIGFRKQAPYLIFGWLWYVGILVPVIGLIQVGEAAMADRYTYVPLIGIFAATIWGICDISSSRKNIKKIISIIAVIVIAILSIICRNQIRYWRNNICLFSHIAEVTNNHIAHYNLGIAYAESGLYNEAIKAYVNALNIKSNWPEAHYNLGNIYSKTGRYPDAIESYTKAIASNPNFADAYLNLGNIYLKMGMIDKAKIYLRKSKALRK